MKLILVLFLVSTPLLVTATEPATYHPSTEEQCSEIDLRGELCPDGTPRLPPLRSQGLTNFCFAYATTDVISYSSCRIYSALTSGIIANITNTGAPLKDPGNPVNLGGSPRNLLNMLRTAGNGPCLESQFPSSPTVIMPQAKEEGVDEDRLHDYLMGYYNRRTESNPLACERQPVTGITFNERLVPVEQNPTNLQLLRALREALETRQVPAVLQVISSVVMSNQEVSAARPANIRTDHYISVVGRKWLNGHCHYLYRDQNSMRGSPWPRAEDHPDQAASSLPSSDYFYIWVREENLLNNADDVIFNTN